MIKGWEAEIQKPSVHFDDYFEEDSLLRYV